MKLGQRYSVGTVRQWACAEIVGQWDSKKAVVLVQHHGWEKWDSRTIWDIVTLGQSDNESTMRCQHKLIIVILWLKWMNGVLVQVLTLFAC